MFTTVLLFGSQPNPRIINSEHRLCRHKQCFRHVPAVCINSARLYLYEIADPLMKSRKSGFLSIQKVYFVFSLLSADCYIKIGDCPKIALPNSRGAAAPLRLVCLH